MKMSMESRRCFQLLSIIVCGACIFLTSAPAIAKPTLPFTLPPALSFPSWTSLRQQFVEKRNANQMKSYSGFRQSNNSLVMIYYHDQTIAVVELGPEKLLVNCELIEIYNERDGQRLLKKLSALNRPLMISFPEMVKLMNQCELVDQQLERYEKRNSRDSLTETNRGIFPANPLTLLSGIIPGTKWCGTGDIASTYSDLGIEAVMDRCCRAHDLCPVKVRSYEKKYSLTNDSPYTKSHCVCDDMLYTCLKNTNTSASQVMGSIYFNLIAVPCVQNLGENVYQFRTAREGF